MDAVQVTTERYPEGHAPSPLTRPASPPHTFLSRSTIVFCR